MTRLDPDLAPRRRSPVEVLVIGSSTGGPQALSKLLPAIATGCPVPVLIVQHMPAEFTQYLAERLARQIQAPIREATDGAVLAPGDIWIAPGDQHMELVVRADGPRLQLSHDAPVHSCRPSVDVLFRSAAAVYGRNVLGVVLTGMGKDGVQGCQAIRDAGGQILVQDRDSSVIWGMPGAVVAAGLADAIQSLDELGPEITQRLFRRRSLSGSRSASQHL